MKMAMRCYFQDVGYCKYGVECKFQHYKEVCKERTCRSRYCQRRHPRPCRNFFLKHYCRFGEACKFGHFYDCENCENLKFLKVEKILKEKDDMIEKN